MISYKWGLKPVCCIQIHNYQFKVSCLFYHQLLFMWLYAGTKSNKSHSIWVLGLCSKLYDAHPDVDFTKQGQSGNNQAAPMSFTYLTNFVRLWMMQQHGFMVHLFETFKDPITIWKTWHKQCRRDTCWWLLWCLMDPSGHDLSKCERAFYILGF